MSGKDRADQEGKTKFTAINKGKLEHTCQEHLEAPHPANRSRVSGSGDVTTEIMNVGVSRHKNVFRPLVRPQQPSPSLLPLFSSLRLQNPVFTVTYRVP